MRLMLAAVASLIGTFTRRQGDRSEILDAVVALAHALGLKVTAEGIETIAQCERLRHVRCEYGQGYLFATPLDAAAAQQAIASARSWLPVEVTA